MKDHQELATIYENATHPDAYKKYASYADHPEHIRDDIRGAFEQAGIDPNERLIGRLAEIAVAYASRAVRNYKVEKFGLKGI